MAEEEEDFLPRRAKTRIQPLGLDPLGIAELEEYIRELQREISRAEGEILRKQGHRSNADAVFRPPGHSNLRPDFEPNLE